MTEQELLDLREKYIKEAEENKEPMFMGAPESWFEDLCWICRNEHISKRYLKTDKGPRCLECFNPVILMPPERYGN